jgi:hypothetical protein
MATKYIEGTTIRAYAEFRNDSNVLVDPLTVTLKYKQPDNVLMTKTSPLEVLKVSTGIYEIYLILSQAGKYAFRWEGSGNNGSVSETVITVQASQVL